MKSFDIDSVIYIQESTFYIFLLSSILYLPCIFYMRYLMQRLSIGKILQLSQCLKIPHMLWNIILSIFSGVGSYKLLYHLYEHGIIDNQIINGDCGLWMTLFVLSKIAELLDTVFIILRSKPLLFIHYYHHLATLLVAWSTLYMFPYSLFWGALINYIIHTMMYLYFAIDVYGYKGLKPYGKYLTFLQTSQMLVMMCIVNYYKCQCNYVFNYKYVKEAEYFTTAVYGSYLYLFVKLYKKKSKD